MRFVPPLLLVAGVSAADAQGAPEWTLAPGSSPDHQMYVRAGRSQTIAHVTSRLSLEPREAASAMLEELAKRGLCPAGPTANATAQGAVAASLDADRRCMAVATPLPGGGSRVVIGRTAGPDRLHSDALVAAVVELATRGAPVGSPAAPTPTPTPTLATNPAPAPRASASGARPVGAVLHGSSVLQGVQLQPVFTVTPWLLYANGVAAACPDIDPIGLPLDPMALDAREGCEGGRWRRGPAGIELQLGEGDPWTSDAVWEQRPPASGATIDFDGAAKGGMVSHAPLSGVAAFTVLRNGRLRLGRDGRIEGAVVTTAGYNAKRTAEEGLIGRYRIDGFVIEIATPDGGTVRRPFVFSEQDSVYRGAYFMGEAYLQPK